MNTLLALLIALLTTGFTPQKTAIVKNTTRVTQEANRLSGVAPQLNKRVLMLALAAYHKAEAKGKVRKPILTVIDYSLPSSKQRMWVFDIKRDKLLYNTHVAHGLNSGMTTPTKFSNKDSSKQSSLGTYVTKNTYVGANGYSLNLQGLEKNFNDHALDRRIVMHGAWYVEPSFIKKAGRAGRSWGCPSIAPSLARPLINTIKDGSVIFAYYPDKKYLANTGYAVI